MSDSEDSDDFDPQELIIVEELKRQQRLAAQGPEEKEEKTFFHNVAGMESCRAAITLPSHFHWVETLSITTPEPFVLDNLQDDLKRESQFYEMTLQGVKTAINRLDEADIPYQRPTDFYAEMVKPDKHMARVKDALLREKKKMAFVDTRKKAAQAKKMAKEVRAEQIKAKGQGKRDAKAQLAAIKAKKGRNKNEMRVPRTSLTANIKDAEDSGDAPERGQKSRKRQGQDSQYGFGGKKRRLKSNTAESLDDVSFPVRQNKTGGSKKRIKAPRAGGKKRPGKNARRNNRS